MLVYIAGLHSSTWNINCFVCLCGQYLRNHSIQLLELGSELAHFFRVASLLLLMLSAEAPSLLLKLRLLTLLQLRLQVQRQHRFMGYSSPDEFKIIIQNPFTHSSACCHATTELLVIIPLQWKPSALEDKKLKSILLSQRLWSAPHSTQTVWKKALMLYIWWEIMWKLGWSRA